MQLHPCRALPDMLLPSVGPGRLLGLWEARLGFTLAVWLLSWALKRGNPLTRAVCLLCSQCSECTDSESAGRAGSHLAGCVEVEEAKGRRLQAAGARYELLVSYLCVCQRGRYFFMVTLRYCFPNLVLGCSTTWFWIKKVMDGRGINQCQISGAAAKTYCWSLNKNSRGAVISTFNSSHAFKLCLYQRTKSNEGKVKRTIMARNAWQQFTFLSQEQTL